VAIGMYLPLPTTFAIFVGGVIRWVMDSYAKKRGLNEAQRIRTENVGILIASGLIAGEALMGLVTSACLYFDIALPKIFDATAEKALFHTDPSYIAGLTLLAMMTWMLVKVPLDNAGRADEPAPPAAMM
jgi:hypothetical protein